jgi:hypothetical protein
MRRSIEHTEPFPIAAPAKQDLDKRDFSSLARKFEG